MPNRKKTEQTIEEKRYAMADRLADLARTGAIEIEPLGGGFAFSIRRAGQQHMYTGSDLATLVARAWAGEPAEYRRAI